MPLSSGKKRPLDVLVVEDDEDDFFLIQDIFRQINPAIRLVWKKNGKEAFQFLIERMGVGGRALMQDSEGSLDLVIVDLKLPLVDGFTLLDKIRSLRETQHLPVIVHSTSSLECNVRRCYESGANLYLKKPSGGEEIAILKEFVRLLDSGLLLFPQNSGG